MPQQYKFNAENWCGLLYFFYSSISTIVRTVDVNETLSNIYDKLCDEINISCPILKFTIPLLEFNILSETFGRLFSTTSELKFNSVKLNFAKSIKM